MARNHWNLTATITVQVDDYFTDDPVTLAETKAKLQRDLSTRFPIHYTVRSVVITEERE